MNMNKNIKKLIVSVIVAALIATPLCSFASSGNQNNQGFANLYDKIVNIVSYGSKDVMNGKLTALLQKYFTYKNNVSTVDKDKEVVDGKPIENKNEEEKNNAENNASSYAERILELCNAERAKRGLRALRLDEKLSNGAQMKSLDMAKNGYFSHTSPTYGSPFDMMKSLGISYRYAGENIAMGYRTPEAVVDAWMNSEGHRANILNANYSKMGIGYVLEGNYYTQWFTD